MAKPTTELPPQALPKDAAEAWLAYTNMLASKEAHYSFLESLDQKYQSGGKRSLAEIAHLDGLLNTHNKCVKSFTEAQKSLLTTSPQSHKAFIEILSDTNAHLGTPMGEQ